MSVLPTQFSFEAAATAAPLRRSEDPQQLCEPGGRPQRPPAGGRLSLHLPQQGIATYLSKVQSPVTCLSKVQLPATCFSG